MRNINTGGSAFPETTIVGPDKPSNVNQGMTLRDYFAAKAMQSFIMEGGITDAGYEDWFIAKGAYMMADEMLKAREQ